MKNSISDNILPWPWAGLPNLSLQKSCAALANAASRHRAYETDFQMDLANLARPA
jgi:hypothetical protein